MHILTQKGYPHHALTRTESMKRMKKKIKSREVMSRTHRNNPSLVAAATVDQLKEEERIVEKIKKKKVEKRE